MSHVMRMDKYLANMGIGTRSEVKLYIKKGRIAVNGATVSDSNAKIDTAKDQISFDGKVVQYVEYEYIMLNKPAGVVSATEDKYCKTVLDLIDSPIKRELFPVGRLDKDTEGLLLLTNDGILAHNLLAPKKHISKVYYAKIDGIVSKIEQEAFAEGIQIEEDFKALPAKLHILEVNEETKQSEIEITIYEGKFHQVKRMFEAVGKEVVYLKRLSMGSLHLDEALELGAYRALTKEELDALLQKEGS